MSLIHSLNAIQVQTQQIRTITENLDFIRTASKQFEETEVLIDALIKSNVRRRKSSRKISLFREKKQLTDAVTIAQQEIDFLNNQIDQLSVISAHIKKLNEKINDLFEVFFGPQGPQVTQAQQSQEIGHSATV